MRISDLHEDASAGSIGSASIAGAPSRLERPGAVRRRDVRGGGDVGWHDSINQQRSERQEAQARLNSKLSPELQARQSQSLQAAKARIAKERSFLGRLKSFLEMKQRRMFHISESFDMDDVMSRLSSLETDSDAESTVSFGIEDDEGNLMKVTVRAEQAEEFEERLANELADAARRKEVTGEKTSISMAELLLKLNDEFDIVDASFPTIPSDGVYNADKVQYGVADTAQEDIGGDNLDAFPEGDPMAGGDAAMGGDMGADPMAGGDAGMGGDMGGDMGADPMAGDAGAEGGEGDEFFDDDSVEDFPADVDSENPEQNLLTAVLKMLTADAEAKKAQADAEAEKARAQQAEYTAMAAKNSIAQQEEVMRMEADMERQKTKEKEAKKLSDLARYRVQKAGGFNEGAKRSFGQHLDMMLEFEELDSVQSLTRQKGAIRIKYAPAQGDSPETINYKRQQLSNAMRELDAKIRMAQTRDRYYAKMNKQQQQQPQQAQKPQPTNQQQNPQQGQMQGQQAPGQQGDNNAL